MTAAPYPWHRLRRLSRAQARLESIAAVWISARSTGTSQAERLTALVGGPVRADVVDRSDAFDPHAARCTVRVAGAAIEVRGSSLAARHIAQRVLGGPLELAAARPLGVVERSIWSLVVATALEDLGVAGEVWPALDDVGQSPDNVRTRAVRSPAATGRHDDEPPTIELSVTLGDIALAVQLAVPPSLALRVPPPRSWPRWFDTTMLEVPIVLGRCALHRDDVARLAVRSLVTLERAGEERIAGNADRSGASSRWRPPTSKRSAELEVFGGTVGLRAAQGSLEAEVATGYVPRDMSLPDDAHVELTVSLGTTRLSLRQVAELAVGQIVELGRPLAGPFELRAEGRVVGRGELVEVDGELAVRIVSLGD